MAMTNEEIDAEIARLQSLKEQNNKAQTAESNKPATGIYNPADYVSQITNSMNKSQSGSGNKFSNNLNLAKNAGKRSSKTEDMFGNPLPDTAYEYITQMLNTERAKGPVNKHTLRMIENSAKLYYNVPSKFDISGKGWFSNTDSKMAKAMNSMSYNGKPQAPVQTPAQKPQTPKNIQATQSQDISPKVKADDERTSAYKRIKAKQASDADLALFKNYTEEELKKIGFGPISIKIIKGTVDDATGGTTGSTTGGTTGGTTDGLTGGTTDGLTDEEKQFVVQYNNAAQSRKPVDRVFLTSENVKRYNDLIKKQNEAKKQNETKKPEDNGLTDDDMAFMKQFDQYRQQVSSRQAYSPEAKKFITDQANVARYRKLYQRKKSTKQ